MFSQEELDDHLDALDEELNSETNDLVDNMLTGLFSNINSNDFFAISTNPEEDTMSVIAKFEDLGDKNAEIIGLFLAMSSAGFLTEEFLKAFASWAVDDETKINFYKRAVHNMENIMLDWQEQAQDIVDKEILQQEEDVVDPQDVFGWTKLKD